MTCPEIHYKKHTKVRDSCILQYVIKASHNALQERPAYKKCSVIVSYFSETNRNELHLSPSEWAKIRSKYAFQKPISDLLFDGNCNFSSVCYRLRDICNRNMNDIILDLQIGPMSNINITIKCKCRARYLMAIVTFALSVTVYEIFAEKKYA